MKKIYFVRCALIGVIIIFSSMLLPFNKVYSENGINDINMLGYCCVDTIGICVNECNVREDAYYRDNWQECHGLVWAPEPCEG